MTLPDPATFIGSRCRIKRKTGKTYLRKILVIDANGVTVEEPDGCTKIFPFSEIDQVSHTK